MATLNNPEEAQALSNQVGTSSLPPGYMSCPYCGGSGMMEGFGYIDICHHCDASGIERARDSKGKYTVTTAASERPNTTTEADENASKEEK